jgi:hypothetical protein
MSQQTSVARLLKRHWELVCVLAHRPNSLVRPGCCAGNVCAAALSTAHNSASQSAMRHHAAQRTSPHRVVVARRRGGRPPLGVEGRRQSPHCEGRGAPACWSRPLDIVAAGAGRAPANAVNCNNQEGIPCWPGGRVTQCYALAGRAVNQIPERTTQGHACKSSRKRCWWAGIAEGKPPCRPAAGPWECLPDTMPHAMPTQCHHNNTAALYEYVHVHCTAAVQKHGLRKKRGTAQASCLQPGHVLNKAHSARI